jgi:hypothetical protein
LIASRESGHIGSSFQQTLAVVDGASWDGDWSRLVGYGGFPSIVLGFVLIEDVGRLRDTANLNSFQ